MNKAERRELLFNFFAAYFHEDWLLEAKHPDEVVTEYMSTATASELCALAEAVLDYAKDFRSDKELEKSLFPGLGCYYCPSADGLSARTWLERVAGQLATGAQASDP